MPGPDFEAAGPDFEAAGPDKGDENTEIEYKIMKSGMKQVQVPPFELILRQDVAKASRNPLECLPAPKTANKYEKMSKMRYGQPFRAIYTGIGPDVMKR